MEDIDNLRNIALQEGAILLDSNPYEHPDFPNAQTATPLIVSLDVHQKHIYQREFFGPMSFVITCEHIEQAVERATEDARDFSNFLLFTPYLRIWNGWKKYMMASASVGNLIEHLPLFRFAIRFSSFGTIRWQCLPN